MAQVQKNSKILRGRVGNLVFRVFNGKEVVSLRPCKYKKSTSPEAIKNKNRFAAVVALARFINRLPELSKLWETSNQKGNNNYMKILKTNLTLTDGGDLSVKNIILPPDGFGNPVSDIIFNEDKLTIYFTYSEEDLPLLNNKYNLYLVFYKSGTDKKEKLTPGLDLQIINDIELTDRLEIDLKPSFKYFAEEESNILIFCSLCTLNAGVESKIYSNTYGKIVSLKGTEL